MPRTKAKPTKVQGRGRGSGSGKVPPVVKKGKKAIEKPSIVPAKQIKVKKVVKAKTTGNPRVTQEMLKRPLMHTGDP